MLIYENHGPLFNTRPQSGAARTFGGGGNDVEQLRHSFGNHYCGCSQTIAGMKPAGKAAVAASAGNQHLALVPPDLQFQRDRKDLWKSCNMDQKLGIITLSFAMRT